MGFPDDEDLPLILEAAYGADPNGDPSAYAFTDISDRLVRSSDVHIRTGRSPGAQTANAGSASFAIDNDDGAWSPLNPVSTLFPYVRLGLPMRLRYRLAMATFSTAVTNGWGSTDDGYVWTLFGAGGSVVTSNWNVSAGVGTHLVPVANANRTSYLGDVEVPDVEVLVTVSLAITNITGGNVEPANILLRGTSTSSFYTARVEITTAEAVQVKLYDPSGNLLSSATVAGLTHTSSQALRVRAQIVGNFFAIKVWAAAGSEPAGWHATAVDDAAPRAGWIGISSGLASGNSNAPVTFSYDDLVVTVGRASGFTASLQPDFIPTTDGDPLSVTRVTLGGRLRSLSQNAQPARAALERTILADGPSAAWTFGDGSGAELGGSAISGGQPMRVVAGTPTFGTNDDLPAGVGASAIDLTNASMSGAVVDGSASAWSVEFVATAADAAAGALASIFIASGSWERLDIYAPFAGSSGMQFVTRGGGGAFTGSWSVDNNWHHYLVTAAQSGGNVNVRVYQDGVLVASPYSGAGTLGALTEVNMNSVLFPTSTAMSFVDAAVHNQALDATAAANRYQAVLGFVGELPTDRLARLGLEDDVAIDIVAGGSTQPMGPQPVATFLELLQDCALVDGGWLGEQIDGFGLSYVPLAARVNRDADMTINLATYRVTSGDSASVLAPTYDDQGVVNAVTASRPDGSSATRSDAAHIAALGRYEADATVNVESDEQLPDQARWRVNLGTGQAVRYPNTPVNLHANLTSLLMPWLGLRPGLSRIVRTGLPAKSGTADDDRMLDGYTETLRPRGWTGGYDGSPSAPLQIAVYGSHSAQRGRFGAYSTVLAEDLTDIETAADVNSGGEVWATTSSHPSRFPFDVTIGGLDYSCTAITGTAPNYTLTLVRLATDKAHLTGTSVTVTDTGRYGL
ncbi:hypothetical protein [Roseateles sp.]|uniref:hypothetical protein n=1 Tax=Roseateles sp. TaxID=1971397 RepID=UPI002F408C9C